LADRLLAETLVLVLASTVAVAVLVRLRFSPIVGYVAAGLAVGPHGLGLLPVSEGIRFLGELGIVLLMFIVGLEFSLPRLVATRGLVFGMGGLQVAATATLAAAFASLGGTGWLGAVVLGGAVAMSSTAIAVRQLAAQEELGSRHGRLALGILLFQDLATLPFLVIIGAAPQGGGGVNPLDAALRATVALGAFLAIALLARRALARLIEWVARRRSAELFLLATLSVVLGAAFVAGEIGLSLPVGAFLIGMLVGESDFRHQVEEEIRPFRDTLLGLFFLTVGMGIDLGAAAARPLLTLGAALLLVALKTLVVFGLGLAAGWGAASALRAGLVLAHGGEFALLIVGQGLAAGLVEPAAAQLVLAAVALSLVLAPALIQWNERLAALLVGRSAEGGGLAGAEPEVARLGEALSDHVILCGCGRVGRPVAMVLEGSGVPYLALEADLGLLRRAQRQGHRVVFGDATRHGILRAAGLGRARAVVVTLSDAGAVERLLRRIRHDRPELPVLVSTDEDAALGPLIEAGATRILPENLAAGLALAAQALAALGLPPHEVEARISAARAELTPELRELPP
jgi:CPA2 family monovalent cation:H+ antiporter-2